MTIDDTILVLAGISPMAGMVRIALKQLDRILTNSIARPRGNLKTVGKGLSGAIIDEVVR